MSKPLPTRPNLEQLRTQARDLRKSHAAGDDAALQRIQENHPGLGKKSAAEIRSAKFTLGDAQWVIAREYGFASWPKLKEHIESVLLDTADPMELVKRALAEDDAVFFRCLVERHPEIKARINEPVAAFDSPLITTVRSREMLDALVAAGADLNARSRWWAGGFGLLDHAGPELAAYAIQRGARVDVHAAARLGFIGKLRELVAADPSLVHARGGDGQTPLHFAGTVEVAEFLLDHGAVMDARDVDHESTPAQYMIRDRQDVCRFLIQRGCQTDLLMAAALGDAALIRRHLDADPLCINLRVDDHSFPKQNPRSGGTIYQWTLGWHVSAHEVARQFGHGEIFRLLMERSPADVKLLAACWAGDEATVKTVLAEQPGLVSSLTSMQRSQIAHAARNNQSAAVRAMLAAGLPVAACGQHGATPLHWAAFHGNVEMAWELLRYNPPLEAVDRDFKGTPLGWAVHGSEHGWHRQSGDYPAVVTVLLKAGAEPPEKIAGTAAVQTAIHAMLTNRR